MPIGMDQSADRNGVEFVRLSRLYAFPDFVKSADATAAFGPRQLPASAYADPRTRQFPCDTAAATWISALYFQEKAAEFHAKDRALIAANLDSYADYHRIRPAVEAMRAHHAGRHKAAEDALPDSAYAYVTTLEDGRKDRHLRVASALDVKQAADWLAEHRDRVPLAHRQKIAGRILEKAAQYGAALGERRDALEKQAGRGVGDPAAVVRMIEGRAALARDPATRAGILKIAQAIREAPRSSLRQDRLAKLAETVDLIDRGLGLVGKYGPHLPRPEDVIFSATFTKAAAELHAVVRTTSGRVYEKQALGRLSVDDVRGCFGDEFADRVRTGMDVDPEKMAEEVHTLPRPDAELLDAMLSDNGIAPVLKTAGARVGLPDREWDDLAEQYARRVVGG